MKRFTLFALIMALLVGMSTAQAQDPLRILTIDYMGEALEAADVYEQDFDIELTVVNQQELREVTHSGALAEFDLVLVDNQEFGKIASVTGDRFITPICELVPEFCPDPIPLDICQLSPWLPQCGCQFGLSCPPWILVDVPIIIDPWVDMELALPDLIDVVESEQIFIDPRTSIGVFLEPAIFDVARPQVTIDLDEAFLAFTAACNYVMNYEEFTERGFVPIVVEDYEETPFGVSPYIATEGNIETAIEFSKMLMNNPEMQLKMSEAVGLLPGNIEALEAMLPDQLK